MLINVHFKYLFGGMKSRFLVCISIVFSAIFFAGCYRNAGRVQEIRVGLHNNNQLKIQIDVLTTSLADAYAEFWPANDSTQKMLSTTVKNSLSHVLVICNVLPKTTYNYHIITIANGEKKISKTYNFKTNDLPMWLQEQFKAVITYPKYVPTDFKNGLMLVNKKYAPGIACLVDYKGQLRWYHTVDGIGYKVVHFTKDNTILALLGTNDEPTSYGSQVLEVNMLGDTLFHIQKGQGDFKQSIHHEILKNDRGQIATITVEKKIMDLTSIGGKKKDTISSDGIIVLDSHAKMKWHWSVFDVTDPLKDPNLLKNKKDWTHANSLNYDTDGNYLISFYNTGQIWKVDAKTGKVIWKFGKGGDITVSADCDFTQAHAAHINSQGDLMFFDNGTEKMQSEVFAVKINEAGKNAKVDMHFKLPQEVFNGRMGSAYMINDTSILCCCSKKHILVLANRKGTLLWTMESAMPSYRAEFIKASQLAPYLKP
jgi:arylsulfate sulfotransferase